MFFVTDAKPFLRHNPAMSQVQGIESELTRRILVSERTRSMIMASTLSVVLPCLLAFLFVAIHHLGLKEAYFLCDIFALCLLWATFEWWSTWKLGRAIRDSIEPHRLRFYLNAIVEVAIPMIVVFIAADNMPPVNPINGPFVYSFFLFIILSPLRLDIGLCLFTGLITASAYTLLVFLHWHQLAAAWDGHAF